MRDKYIHKKIDINEIRYKYGDFEIEGDPIKTRRRSLAERVQKYIHGPNHHQKHH